MASAAGLKKGWWPRVAFLFPVVCLMAAVGVNEYQLQTSQELVLPIEGVDPRDLLSGRFLVYKIRYDLKCPAVKSYPYTKTAYACFDSEKNRYVTLSAPPGGCTLFIKGRCKSQSFETGVYRYYIPDQQAPRWEGLFGQARQKSAVLSVTKKGHIFTKDILIDGRSLKSFIP